MKHSANFPFQGSLTKKYIYFILINLFFFYFKFINISKYILFPVINKFIGGSTSILLVELEKPRLTKLIVLMTFGLSSSPSHSDTIHFAPWKKNKAPLSSSSQLSLLRSPQFQSISIFTQFSSKNAGARRRLGFLPPNAIYQCQRFQHR